MYIVWDLRGFKDLKNPFSLFSLMYMFFLTIGFIPFSLIYGFENRVAKLILIGFFLYILGYVVSRKVIPNSQTNENVKSKKYYMDWPYLLFAFIVIYGLLGMLIFYFQAGGIPLFSEEMMSESAQVAQGRGYRGIVTTGYRSPTLEILLTSILIYCYGKRKSLALGDFVKIVGIAIIFLLFIGLVRKGGGLKESFFIILAKQFFSTTYVNLQNLSYIMDKFPEHVPFQYGKVYFMNFLMIRPGPDIDFTIWLRQQLGLTHFSGGATPSIIGEWYLNFGYVGIMGMFLMGIFSSYLEKHLSNSRNIFSLVRWAIITVAFLKAITGGIANVILKLTLNLLLLEVIVISSKFPIFDKSVDFMKKKNIQRKELNEE
jgi:hypothetical protein